MLWLALVALTAAPDLPPCERSQAVHVDARVLAAERERWFGRCVAVTGYVRRDLFYADAGAFYASVAIDRESRGNSGWLGLYLADDADARPHMVRAAVIGRLDSCTRMYDAAERAAGPRSFVMLVGSCHHNPSDLVLMDATVRVFGRASFRRLTGEAARRAFGDLLPASPDRPAPQVVVDLSDSFLSAIRHQDETVLERLVQPWSEQFADDPAGARAFNAYAAGEGQSPLALLRTTGTSPQRAYFVQKQTEIDTEVGYLPQWYICFCTINDCSGQWPISAVDALATADRPYSCLRAVNDEDFRNPPDHLALDRRMPAEEAGASGQR